MKNFRYGHLLKLRRGIINVRPYILQLASGSHSSHEVFGIASAAKVTYNGGEQANFGAIKTHGNEREHKIQNSRTYALLLMIPQR